jgi:hypothetical protein
MPNFDRSNFPPLPTRQTPRRSQARGDKVADGEDLRTTETLASVNDLPDELLLSVLHYLPGIDLDHFHLLTLVSLSSTNRRFHRLVAEKLYITFDSHFCEPYLFLRTIVSNVYLAGLLRHADITYGNWAHRERNRHAASAQDKKIIKEGFRSFNMPDWKIWATECNTENIELDILFSAILMHTPKVSSIRIFDGHIGTHLRSRSPKWANVLKKGSLGIFPGSMHRFEQLRSLHVKVDTISLAQLANCFRIPLLRKLHLLDFTYYSSGGYDETTLPHMIPRHCNNLEELYLKNGFVQPLPLEVLLASSKGLRVFNYDLDFDLLDFDIMEEFEGEEGTVPLTSIISALQCQRNSLESLTFRCDIIAEPRFRGEFALDEGFEHFSKLKYLSCPLGSIINMHDSDLQPLADKLPPSVTAIHFIIRKHCADEDKAIMPALEQMADTFATSPPSCLEELKITVDLPGPWFRYDWSRIVQPLSHTGIAVVIEEIGDEPFHEHWDIADREILSAASVSSAESDEVSLYSE